MQRIPNKRDFFTGSAFLVGALFFLIYSYTQVEISGLRVLRGYLSPQSYPHFVLYVLSFLAILLMISGLYPGQRENASAVTETRNYLRVVVGIVFSIIYIVLMQLISYIPATMVMLATYIVFMGSRNYKIILPVVILIPLILYYFFSHLMHVLLP